MKPGRIYTLNWNTVPHVDSYGGPDRTPSLPIAIRIYDYGILIEDDADAETIVLQPAVSPLKITVIDNDRDKFKSIRSKQASIKFVTNRALGQDITTFSDAYDNQFYVVITAGVQVLLYGYLMLPDGQMPFLPDPQVVELIATDHLGALKEIALTDQFEDVPTGKKKIAEWVAMALAKTGLDLSHKVINNLRHGSGTRTADPVTFAATGNEITVDFNIGFFYVGMPLRIEGSVSNNMDTVVTEIISSTKIAVADTLVNETASIYSITFTDISSTSHLWNTVYLDAKTFEGSDIGATVDCYDALTKILGDDCVLFQHNGSWMTIRIDEYDENPLLQALFDSDGGLISEAAATDLNYSVGADEKTRWQNADALLQNDRPNRFITETFEYINPQEIICNPDFSRGTGGTTIDPTDPNQEINDELECWEWLREGSPSIGSNLDQPPEPGSLGVRYRLEEYGYEKARYLRSQSDGGFRHYFKSSSVPVAAGDKIELGVDFRLATVETITNINMVHVRLTGDDGFFYDWDYDQPTGVSSWVQKTAVDVVFDAWFRVDWSGQDTTQWYNVMATSLKMPVAGTLEVRLVNAVSETLELWFSNFTFNYIPLINGSYQQYGGHTNTVRRQDEGYLAKRENTIYIGDAPTEITKGAMFLLVASNYTLTSRFYAAARTSDPLVTDFHPFGWHQAFAVWNQYRTANRIFAGSLIGLDTNWFDLCHRYLLTDANGNTTGRYFLLLSFTQDWHIGICGNVNFVECYNSADGRIYTDEHIFKYINGS